MPKNNLRWMPLDNAAKIYPAARRRNWSNVFRLSVTLKETVDPTILEQALAQTVPRFPSIAVRLRRGLFWYYLEQLSQPPQIRQESSYPLTRMSKQETRQCALRVIVYQNRIAVEFFHSLTDGNGALIFLKTLTAAYLECRYGVQIPCRDGVLDRKEAPSPQELEDSFPKYAGTMGVSRQEKNSWQLSGTPEVMGFLHNTCLELSSEAVRQKAHQYGVSVTAFLSAAMLEALQQIQAQQIPDPKKRRPLKLQIPVNLRSIFPSSTLRNFALYTIPEILPRLGHYSFPELCQTVHHHMGQTVNAKYLSRMIHTNVSNEQLLAVRILPLFVKNIIMKAVFDAVGEITSCLSLSNLGQVRVPEVMEAYIEKMDFILGVKAIAPYNCGVLSFGERMYINFIRNTQEPLLEQQFYRVLQSHGLQVKVQSNKGGSPCTV